jgi:hypothetical protein
LHSSCCLLPMLYGQPSMCLCCRQVRMSGICLAYDIAAEPLDCLHVSWSWSYEMCCRQYSCQEGLPTARQQQQFSGTWHSGTPTCCCLHGWRGRCLQPWAGIHLQVSTRQCSGQVSLPASFCTCQACLPLVCNPWPSAGAYCTCAAGQLRAALSTLLEAGAPSVPFIWLACLSGIVFSTAGVLNQGVASTSHVCWVQFSAHPWRASLSL